jgi:hypothetical protein
MKQSAGIFSSSLRMALNFRARVRLDGFAHFSKAIGCLTMTPDVQLGEITDNIIMDNHYSVSRGMSEVPSEHWSGFPREGFKAKEKSND